MIDNALKAWPDRCKGAYICCLSNPQNLDISEVLNHADGSPFERILCSDEVAAFVMLANANTPIHSRLWCILEAFVAATRKILNITISGQPVDLLTGTNRDQLAAAESNARSKCDAKEASVKAQLEEQLRSPELLRDENASAAADVQRRQQLREYLEAAGQVAEAKLAVLSSPDADLLDLSKARCSYEADGQMIREKIAGKEEQVAGSVSYTHLTLPTKA